MRRLRGRLISHKLFVIILSTAIISILVTFTFLLLNDIRILREQQKRKLTALAEVIGRNVRASIAFDDQASAAEILSALNAEKHIQAAAVYLPGGDKFVSYGATEPALGKLRGTIRPSSHDAVLRPIRLEDKIIGYIFIRSGAEELGQLIHYYTRFVLVIMFFAVALASLLSFLMQKTISTPIRELTLLAREISASKSYSVRALPRTDDEIGVLAESFNQMLTEIEAREAGLRQHERALRESRERLKLALSGANAGTWEWDITTGQTIWSEECYKLYGIDSRTAPGTFAGALTYIHADDRARVGSAAQHSVETGEDISVEYRIEHPEKGLRWILAVGRPFFGSDGRPVRIAGILLDISERKKAEEEIRRYSEELKQTNEDLAKSNRELEQFAYIASHDLQEPLRKIITFSERLTEYQSALSDRPRDYLARMQSAGRRMKTVIEDLLQYSRISRGESKFETVNLSDVLSEVLSDLEMLIARSGARIRSGPLPTIQGSRSQIRHMFQNLITNSIKFAQKDALPRIAIDAVERDAEVDVAVADNGIGFDEKYSEKIFQPFQRLHLKEEYEGTGIGLSIVQKIVQNHGGKISVKSTPGKGSVFTVTLPRKAMVGAAHARI